MLDISKCKKISQDNSMAMFKHPDGHEIKIAISGLSPTMRKKLADLPVHQAEGTKDDVIESPDIDVAEPEAQAIEASVPQAESGDEIAEAAPYDYKANPNNPANIVETPAEQEQPAPEAPAAPEAPSPAQAASVQAPMAPVTPEQKAAQRTAENIKLSEDLKYGHIKPQTYHDLFAKKDTLGKIGSVFGMMLAGAGAGLTHQPNILLHMMDKEIERDLEAQKENQTNKQSWFNNYLAEAKQQPEIAKGWAEGANIANEADAKAYENFMSGMTTMSASTDFKNSQRAFALHKLQTDINKMPPGPQRDQYQHVLDNQAVPFFLEQAAKDNLDTEHKIAALKAANPVPQQKANPPPTKGEAKPGVKYDSINEQKFNAMIQKGKFAPKAADAIPQALLSAVNKEKEDLTVNRNNLADAVDSFHTIAKLQNAGQAPGIGSVSNMVAGAAGALGTYFGGPMGGAMAAGTAKLAAAIPGETLRHYFERNRDIQVEALKSRLGGNMSEDDKNKLAQSLLPSWADSPESMAEAHRKMIQHFESNPAEVAPNLSRYGLKYPMPKYEFKMPKKEESKAKDESKKEAAKPTPTPSGKAQYQ